MASAPEISDRIIEAVLAQKLAPGLRLGEQQLADLFGCSRTIVREALMRLAARGLVAVSPRRGWYLIEPTLADAREAFEAREVIETGLLRRAGTMGKEALGRLRAHVSRQKAAVAGSDVGLRSFLLGDFHVCLAECMGNRLLAEAVRDYTARTTLIAMRHQSGDDAAKSCAEHVRIVEALAAGDMRLAERLLINHLRTWDSKLPIPEEGNSLDRLRRALVPEARPSKSASRSRAGRRAAAPRSSI